ncbi:MAG: RNA-directed DNA polymerase, partial [Planctomycetaceae bacterium]
IAAQLRRQPRPAFVMKRDITNFFDSIDHRVLLEKLCEFVEPDDYLFELLSACVTFRYELRGSVQTAETGVPFGSAVACLFANVYLMRLDARLSELPGFAFFRYADDLLGLAESSEVLQQAAAVFDEELMELKLRSKPSHHEDFVLSHAGDQEFDLPRQSRFRHLGLEFRSDGSIGLARDKFRKLRNLFRFAFRRNKSRIRHTTNPEKRARALAGIARETIADGVRNVALIDYYLRHVNDEPQLKRLDRWLAEEVLSLAFGGGHKKGYFRRIPYSRLREMGLPSLVHRRRLILHGHLQSPFFIWKSDRLRRRNGGTAVRPNSHLAFSQSPEAAADDESS